MYKLLKDKNNEFKCEIKLEGANSKNALVRLFLQGDGCEYSFKGQIVENKCTIPLGKLKKFESLLESGKIRLEVIAEDTWFVPYESDYVLEQSKSVTVEVVQQQIDTIKKPMVEVKVSEPEKKRVLEKKELKKPSTKIDHDSIKIQVLEKFLKESFQFNGTKKSLSEIVKSSQKKKFFNLFCEKNNLDRLKVLKQIVK